jgi:hypothetical protein
MYCGILKLRNIVVSAGRCPFCLANSCLVGWGEHEKVVTAFTNAEDFRDHIRKHLRDIRGMKEPHHCPHPLCPREKPYAWADLVHHFYDDHGITEDIFGAKNFPKERPPPVEKSLSVGSGSEESECDPWQGLQEPPAKKRQKRKLTPREAPLKDLRG